MNDMKKETYKDPIKKVYALICPDYAEELRCIVQEWGVTGEDKQGVLLDDGNTHIVYDGAEYIPVACGKTSVDLRSVAF